MNDEDNKFIVFPKAQYTVDNNPIINTVINSAEEAKKNKVKEDLAIYEQLVALGYDGSELKKAYEEDPASIRKTYLIALQLLKSLTYVNSDNKTEEEHKAALKNAEYALRNQKELNTALLALEILDYVPFVGSINAGNISNKYRLLGDKQSAIPYDFRAGIGGVVDLATLPFILLSPSSYASSLVGDWIGRSVGGNFGGFVGGTIGGFTPSLTKYATYSIPYFRDLKIINDAIKGIHLDGSDLIPLSRFRLGEVEIDDPFNNYRMLGRGGADAFIKRGELFAPKYQESAFDFDMPNPMYARGTLWYGTNGINQHPDLLVTRQPMYVANSKSIPRINLDETNLTTKWGTRRVPVNPESQNLDNTLVYSWNPNYYGQGIGGYVRLRGEKPSKMLFYERPSSGITEAEKAGIPKGDRNLPENLPLQYFTENDFISLPLLGKGEEAITYNNGDKVLKILRNPLVGHSLDFNFNEIPFNSSRIGMLHKQYINPRNSHPIFEPIKFEGIYTSKEGDLFPIISQQKLNDLSHIPNFKLEPEINEMLNRYGYKLNNKGVYASYENEFGSISDLHNGNLGIDVNGNLKAFDATAGKIDYDAFELKTAKIKQNSYLKTFEEYLQLNPKDLLALEIYSKIRNYFKENPYEEDFFNLQGLKIPEELSDKLEPILTKYLNMEESLIKELRANVPLKKLQGGLLKLISRAKSGIHIKKANRGKFTEYCGGNVTSECILRGKNSSDPKIRKRATFAANARKWKHLHGGKIDFNYLFNKE